MSPYISIEFLALRGWFYIKLSLSHLKYYLKKKKGHVNIVFFRYIFFLFGCVMYIASPIVYNFLTLA